MKFSFNKFQYLNIIWLQEIKAKQFDNNTLKTKTMNGELEFEPLGQAEYCDDDEPPSGGKYDRQQC